MPESEGISVLSDRRMRSMHSVQLEHAEAGFAREVCYPGEAAH